jgi:SulP family sulfate permease
MLIAVLILSIAVIFFTEQFTYLPKAALAAVILMAIFPLIKLREIITTWKYDQGDGIAELITLLLFNAWVRFSSASKAVLSI